MFMSAFKRMPDIAEKQGYIKQLLVPHFHPPFMGLGIGFAHRTSPQL
jgi:hypothetical protein